MLFFKQALSVPLGSMHIVSRLTLLFHIGKESLLKSPSFIHSLFRQISARLNSKVKIVKTRQKPLESLGSSKTSQIL